MKLKAKLVLLCGIPITGLLLSAIACIYSVHGIKEKTHLVKTESAVYEGLARDLQMQTTEVQQYFQDISATRGQDGLDDGFAEAAKCRESFLASLKKFEDMYQRENNRSHLDTIQKLRIEFDNYYQKGRAMAETYVKDGPAGGNKLMADFDAAAENLHKELDPFLEEQVEELNQSLADIETTSTRLVATTLWFGIILIFATIVAAVLSIRSITRPINQVVSTLSLGAEQTASAAVQISATTQGVAEGASEQAASLEETSASLEEILSMTKRNSENAENGKRLGTQARDAASAGLERLDEMSGTLASIKGAINEMETAVREMQGSSQEVAKIIKTIDEIAFQTNLLALNAAVEAARAGEAGAGFAVVADEVRALAQRSAQAAKDTSEKIATAVKRSELGGVASAKVVQSLGEVEVNAQHIQGVFKGIVDQIKSLDAVVSEIAAASKEQSQGIGEVNMAVGQMDKVTQSNAASAEENASAAEELSAQTEVLKGAVEQLERLIGAQAKESRPKAGAARDANTSTVGKAAAKSGARFPFPDRDVASSRIAKHGNVAAGKPKTLAAAEKGGFQDF